MYIELRRSDDPTVKGNEDLADDMSLNALAIGHGGAGYDLGWPRFENTDSLRLCLAASGNEANFK